ncbi:ankyrin repeat-containing domain protein [Mycena vitilis]|nr:ankyrin repeat-containing domain protein [Mycena vitilis]
MDPLSIAGAIVTFAELAKTIQGSIEKVGENQKNLADLKTQVLNTVRELEGVAQGQEGIVPTRELLTALGGLTAQLKKIDTNCQELSRTQATGLSSFLKSWFKRGKIEEEIKKLREHRTACYTQFQLLSLARVEGHAARTEANTLRLITSAREEELRRWLRFPLDMREKQRATQALRHKDSGGWFLRDIAFGEWKKQPACLWIRGNSGTGKSVLSSIAIDYLFHHRSTNFAIAYFYFDFRDEKKQLLENMLRSIIMQLSAQSLTPYSVLNQHYEACQGQVFPTYDDLLAMLATILSGFTGSYIVLDALDECSEPEGLNRFISTLRGWAESVHLLVASQPHKIFVESAAFVGASVVILEPKKTHADIVEFVNSKLGLDDFKHLQKAKDAAQKIVNKSNGMFRMAECLLRELTRNKVDPDLDAILAKLPNDLFGIYTRFLKPIGTFDFIHVITLLRWLAFSARPVTALELDDALAINFSNPDQWVFEQQKRGRASVLCDLLEGLVSVGPAVTPDGVPDSECSSSDGGEYLDNFSIADSEDEALWVTLAHSSVADYITSEEFFVEYKHDLREAPAHTFLAHSCVAYLLHFETYPLNAVTRSHFPLAVYAANFWSHHLLRCHERGVLQPSTLRLLEQGSQQYIALNCLFSIDFPWQKPDWSRHTPSPLYLCSVIGYVEGVRCLLEDDDTFNVEGGYFSKALKAFMCNFFHQKTASDLNNTADGKRGSALQAACWKGNMEIVQLLLGHGANVNVRGHKDSALQAASEKGHVEIVRLLLEKGADINVVGGQSHSILQVASALGHADIVHLLLEKGANVNAVGGQYHTALQAASAHGHLTIARSLLHHGADVNAMGRGQLKSALEHASVQGHIKLVVLLLERGADVNAQAEEYGGALQGASYEGHLEIVRILLKKGADVNAVSKSYGSALTAASSRRQWNVVHILLHHGANPNAVGVPNLTLRATEDGRTDMVRLLLDHGAVDTVDRSDSGYNDSALRLAAFEGKREIAQLLLERGPAVDTAEEYYRRALRDFTLHGHTAMVLRLIEKGVHVNAKDLYFASEKGQANIVRLLIDRSTDVPAANSLALQAASEHGHLEIVRHILEFGADIRVDAIGIPSKDGRPANALRAASLAGRLEIVQLLLDHGADVNLVDERDGSALSSASREGHAEVVRFLLDHGANADTVGALQDAAYEGHVKIVRLLLEKGAAIDACNRGGSALHNAVRGDKMEVVRVLLEHGADVNAVDASGSALQRAARNGNVETVRFLFEHGADVNAVGGSGSALQGAARHGHADVVRFLLEQSADVNVAEKSRSALRSAASYGHVNIVRILLDHGAHAGDGLQSASFYGQRNIVHLLIDHGADANTVGALQDASYKGQAEIVRLLLDKGADINAVGENGSALHNAVLGGEKEVVRILLKYGANVNAGDEKSGSALQSAARRGYVDVVRVLLEHGAEVNAVGRSGSALQCAAWKGHVDVVQVLLEHGATVHVASGKYGSASEIASAGGHQELAQLLRDHEKHEKSDVK